MADLTPDDDSVEVEEANTRFYRAFESRDLAEMDRVWAHGDHVRCIHPGWSLLVGWDSVRQSWEAIFKDSRELRFSLSDVRTRADGDTAWLTCTEHILSQIHGQISVAAILTTNVFERQAGRWLMVHHHGSHILTAGPPAEVS